MIFAIAKLAIIFGIANHFFAKISEISVPLNRKKTSQIMRNPFRHFARLARKTYTYFEQFSAVNAEWQRIILAVDLVKGIL